MLAMLMKYHIDGGMLLKDDKSEEVLINGVIKFVAKVTKVVVINVSSERNTNFICATDSSQSNAFLIISNIVMPSRL